MREWLEDMIKSIVREPDDVTLSEERGVTTVIYTVSVSPDDTSLFRGRNNRLVRALNTSAALAGLKDRTRYVVKLA